MALSPSQPLCPSPLVLFLLDFPSSPQGDASVPAPLIKTPTPKKKFLILQSPGKECSVFPSPIVPGMRRVWQTQPWLRIPNAEPQNPSVLTKSLPGLAGNHQLLYWPCSDNYQPLNFIIVLIYFLIKFSKSPIFFFCFHPEAIFDLGKFLSLGSSRAKITHFWKVFLTPEIRLWWDFSSCWGIHQAAGGKRDYLNWGCHWLEKES